MDGAAAAGRGGRVEAAVAGTGVAVFVEAGATGTAVAGMGEAVFVAAVAAGGNVAMVGMAGVPVLHAITASRMASPPSRLLN